MTLRLLEDATFNGSTGMTKIFWDTEWEEYRVKLWAGGKRKPLADYHTDDRQDAIDTAKLMVEEPHYEKR